MENQETLLLQEIEEIKNQIKGKTDSMKALEEEVHFQRSMVLNCLFAEYMDDDFVVKHDSYNSGKYLIKKEDGRFQKEISITLSKAKEESSWGEIKDIKVDLEKTYYSNQTTEEEELDNLILLGKIAEKIRGQKEEALQMFKEVASETSKDFDNLKQTLGGKIKIREEKEKELKEVRFKKFIIDLEEGVEFQNPTPTLEKNQAWQISLRRLKVTGYTPSGMTARIAYDIRLSEGEQPFPYKNEVMAYKLRDMFDNFYYAIERDPNYYTKYVQKNTLSE